MPVGETALDRSPIRQCARWDDGNTKPEIASQSPARYSARLSWMRGRCSVLVPKIRDRRRPTRILQRRRFAARFFATGLRNVFFFALDFTAARAMSKSLSHFSLKFESVRTSKS
jgi:hypothetical protein